MTATEKKSALVVGAGLSGLTSAYRLKQAGFHVTVLEKDPNVGGRTTALRKEGFIIDTGALALTGGDANYLGLAKELGLAKKIVKSGTAISIVRDGTLHTIDSAKPFAALFNPVFSWREKFRIAKGIFNIRRQLKAVKSAPLTELADLDNPDSNALAVCEAVFGKAVTDNLLEPAIRVFAGASVDQVSTLCVYNTLSNLANSLVNVEGGLDTLSKTLAQKLDVVCNAEVTAVDKVDGKISVTYQINGALHVQESDVCVISCLLEQADKIYPSIREAGSQLLDNLQYGSVPVVSLAYNKRPDSNACLVQVPLVENKDIMVIFQDQYKAPDRAPEGHGLFSVCIAPRAAEEFATLRDEDAIARIQKYIERLFPEISGHFLFGNVAPWPKAGPKAWPGYYRALHDFVGQLKKDDPVQLAGDFIGGSQEAAVARGNEVAENIITHFGKS